MKDELIRRLDGSKEIDISLKNDIYYHFKSVSTFRCPNGGNVLLDGDRCLLSIVGDYFLIVYEESTDAGHIQKLSDIREINFSK